MDALHDAMLSCAQSNAKVFKRDAPTTTPRGLVLEHGFGRLLSNSKMPKGIRRGRQKKCFSNSTYLVMCDPERFIYCEGFAVRATLGIVVGEHAWCLDAENDFSVVDPTWRDAAPGAYLGLPIKREYLYAKIGESGYYGLLCNNKLGCAPMNDDPSEWLAEIPRAADFTA